MMKRMLTIPVIVILLSVYCLTPFVSAETYNAKQISARCSPAVFFIQVNRYGGVASGSGFFISADGVAVTNHHVMRNSYSAVITTTDNHKYVVEDVLYDNEAEDISVIRISKVALDGSSVESFPYLEMQAQWTVQNGDVIFAIGSPLGFQNTISDGIISNRCRITEGQEDYPEIQITAPITHGSSGGALINDSGYVIGVTSSGVDEAQNLNFARPLDRVMTLDLTAKGTPYIGYFARPIEEVESCLFQNTVYEKNPKTLLNKEIIDSDDTMIGTFCTFYNIDKYYFKISQISKMLVYAGGYPEEYEPEEISAFETLIVGIYSSDDTLITFCNMSYNSKGYPIFTSMVDLKPGSYYICVFNSSGDETWAGRKYFLYMNMNNVTPLTEPPVTTPSQPPIQPPVTTPKHKIGDVVNQAVFTDIIANINGFSIPSYNVNGSTAICAEDLAMYGFQVTWNASSRTLSIKKGENALIHPDFVPTKIDKEQIGVKAYDVLFTDVKTTVNGKVVESFNINGSTIIFFRSLGDFGQVGWDATARIASVAIGGIAFNQQIKTYESFRTVPDFAIALDTAKFNTIALNKGYGYTAINADSYFINFAYTLYDHYLKKHGFSMQKSINMKSAIYTNGTDTVQTEFYYNSKNIACFIVIVNDAITKEDKDKTNGYVDALKKVIDGITIEYYKEMTDEQLNELLKVTLDSLTEKYPKALEMVMTPKITITEADGVYKIDGSVHCIYQQMESTYQYLVTFTPSTKEKSIITAIIDQKMYAH